MPGKVGIKIKAARNLPIMDRSSDTTDAYVEIKLGSTIHKTDVCRKSLNPQFNTDWFRFELDDAELQDEPLQIRLMDHDTYSANDAIGKINISLNPLCLDIAANQGGKGTVLSGWIPVFDTMHGIRGEVNIIVKVDLFSDVNKFRQSSCGIPFFHSPCVPFGYRAQIIHGFVEELVVNDDPEYQWIDKIRTPRASNEARQSVFLKLSGQVQRKMGLKAINMGANSVIGYTQCFDLEGDVGIVVRGIGTAVTLIKDNTSTSMSASSANENTLIEERSKKYLDFLMGFHYSSGALRDFEHERLLAEYKQQIHKSQSASLYDDYKRHEITDDINEDDVAETMLSLMRQEDERGEKPKLPKLKQKMRHFTRSSRNLLSETYSDIKRKFGGSSLAVNDSNGGTEYTSKSSSKASRSLTSLISSNFTKSESSSTSTTTRSSIYEGRRKSLKAKSKVMPGKSRLGTVRSYVPPVPEHGQGGHQEYPQDGVLHPHANAHHIMVRSISDDSPMKRYEKTQKAPMHPTIAEFQDAAIRSTPNISENSGDESKSESYYLQSNEIPLTVKRFDDSTACYEFDSSTTVSLTLTDSSSTLGSSDDDVDAQASSQLQKFLKIVEQTSENEEWIKPGEESSGGSIPELSGPRPNIFDELKAFSQQLQDAFRPSKKSQTPTASASKSSQPNAATMNLALPKQDQKMFYLSQPEIFVEEAASEPRSSTQQLDSSFSSLLSPNAYSAPLTHSRSLINLKAQANCSAANSSFERQCAATTDDIQQLALQLPPILQISPSTPSPSDSELSQCTPSDEYLPLSFSLDPNSPQKPPPSIMCGPHVEASAIDSSSHSRNKKPTACPSHHSTSAHPRSRSRSKSPTPSIRSQKTASSSQLHKSPNQNTNTKHSCNIDSPFLLAPSPMPMPTSSLSTSTSTSNLSHLCPTAPTASSLAHANSAVSVADTVIMNPKHRHDPHHRHHHRQNHDHPHHHLYHNRSMNDLNIASNNAAPTNTAALAAIAAGQNNALNVDSPSLKRFTSPASAAIVAAAAATNSVINTPSPTDIPAVVAQFENLNKLPQSPSKATLTPSTAGTAAMAPSQVEGVSSPTTASTSTASTTTVVAKDVGEICRRSSDSDLSVTPKGNSICVASERLVAMMRMNQPVVSGKNVTGPNTDSMDTMLEYPFLTMTKYPPGFILHLGATVAARSVKLLERVENPDEPEVRDSWWNELRMEIRSHARALGSNVVLGYSELTTISDDVCVLSATGTAAVIDLNRSMSQQDIYMGSKGSMVGGGGGMSVSLEEREILKESRNGLDGSNDANAKTALSSSFGTSGGGNVPSSNVNRRYGALAPLPISKNACGMCHVPYSLNSVPFNVKMRRCAVCRKGRVPDVLLSTLEVPESLPVTGRGCFLQAQVVRVKKDLRSELNAKEISDGLPFLEYELHRVLINKLKAKGMNSIFGLKTQVAIGERMIALIATGTALFLTALPMPLVPRIVAGNSWTDKQKLNELQKKLQETYDRNQEIYQLKCIDPDQQPPDSGGSSGSGLTGPADFGKQSDTDESDDEVMEIDLNCGNKDTCVLEVDDIEDLEIISLLMEPCPPEGFHVVNTETVPGMHDMEAIRNLQMFTQVWRAKLDVGQNVNGFPKHFQRILQTICFKLRSMVPCAICDLRFRLDLPESDQIQLLVTGMTLGLSDVSKLPKNQRRQKQQQQQQQQQPPVNGVNNGVDNGLVAQDMTNGLAVSNKRTLQEDDYIFPLDEDQMVETPTPTSNVPLYGGNSFKQRKTSPSRQGSQKQTNSSALNIAGGFMMRNRYFPLRDRYGIDITPLSFIPGGRIDKYLGNLNFFFIRESTSIRENGGISGFVHSFITELLAVVRAHIASIGGNAMVSFYMKELILVDNQHKNQGQCLVSIGGDAVYVSYHRDD